MDGTSYTWMGNPSPFPPVVNQTAFVYTATRSIFSMDVAGLVNMTITFLSPIFPTDLKRQSLPFSYVDVSVSSSDGKSHNVQVYADMTAGEPCIADEGLKSFISYPAQNGHPPTMQLSFNGVSEQHLQQPAPQHHVSPEWTADKTPNL